MGGYRHSVLSHDTESHAESPRFYGFGCLNVWGSGLFRRNECG
jgi:hypothetical protein